MYCTALLCSRVLQYFRLRQPVVRHIEGWHHARPQQPHRPGLTVENVENLQSSLVRSENIRARREEIGRIKLYVSRFFPSALWLSCC